MTVDTFLAHFEQLAEAPNAVPKLRELILQLAVRGKLVPQDPNDEPASELMKRIQAKKHRSVAEGKLRGSRFSRPIEPDLVSYGLPAGWQWIRLVDLGEICGGGTPSKNRPEYWNGGIPWISPKDMKTGSVVGSETDVSPLALEETAVRLIPADSVLFVGRSGILRRMLPVAINSVPCTVNQDLKVIIPYLRGLSEYVRLMLKGHEALILDRFVKQGTTVQSLVYDELLTQPFGFPPAAEQKRIVAKVDELMALCDELEAKQEAKRAKQIALNRASLHDLVQPNGPSLARAWHRVRDHFDNLYTVPETVSELRQTILQLAVMGRLVPQDPGDLPASELLKKIRAEKERLIAQGKIRKPKPLPPIDSDEAAYDLPCGWEWCYAGDMLLSINDGDHQPPPRSESGVPFLVIGDVSGGRLDFSGPRFVPHWYFDELDRNRVPEYGDVLYTVTGSYGLTLVVDTRRDFCVQRHMAILKIPRDLSPSFVAKWLRSPLAREQASARATGIAQKTVPLGTLRSLVLPLPPLAEQIRIVAKIDELMMLCDDLEAKLQQAKTNADTLLAATAAQLTTGASPDS